MKRHVLLSIEIFLFGLALLSGASPAHAQENPMRGSDYCSLKRMKQDLPLRRIASANSPRHTFDVLHYSLNLDLSHNFTSPFPHSYTASEVVTFRVDSLLSSIQLNAVNTSLAIDSVTLGGASFVHQSDILTITLTAAHAPGDTVSVGIYYHHLDVADNAFYTSSDGMVFTDCEPEGARRWFPCWDRPSDKATTDLTALVPVGVKLGSNGRLDAVSSVGDSLLSYHWVSRDPVATYLVVISAKLGYNLDIEYWHKLSSANDSIPLYFYWNSGENTSNLHYVESRLLQMITYYSQLFGEHPFEKNGFATLNGLFYWGGMENQTLTSLCPNCWSENLVSHEFAHQWFGDMITCGTWADVWLNEGFATYCEALWYEYSGGHASYMTDIQNDAQYYIAHNPHWAIYNPSWASYTPDVNTLFNTAITYDKGACVLHMLRAMLGDSVFFAAIKSYATDTVSFKFKNTVTDDFVAKMSAVTGQDLTWFFDEWVKTPNYPIYNNLFSIDSTNKQVTFLVRQSQTNAPFFRMPLPLRISFADGPDTTVVVSNTVNEQTFVLSFAKVPTGVVFDPDNAIVLKQGTTLRVTSIKDAEAVPVAWSLGQNYPNPFNPGTNIRYVVPETREVTVAIYDVLGRLVTDLVHEEKQPGIYTVHWDAAGFPSGVYFCVLSTSQFSQTRKLLLVK